MEVKCPTVVGGHVPRALAVAAIVLGCLTAIGCTSTGDVTGRVISQTMGSGVASATVTLGTQVVSTDASGTFTLADVEFGQHEVQLSCDGYPSTTTVVNVAEDGQSIEVVRPDSRLTGAIEEVAVEPKTVTSATVTVGGVSYPAEQDGTFEIAGLPPGEAILTVEAPDTLVRDITKTLEPGDNSIEATLSLDVPETYRRYNDAAVFHRNEISYKYLHPDVRAIQSLDSWIAQDTDDNLQIISLTLGDTREVIDFKSKYTGKTYSSVLQVDRTLEYEIPGYGKQTASQAQHWQLLPDGMWYLIFNFVPE